MSKTETKAIAENGLAIALIKAHDFELKKVILPNELHLQQVKSNEYEGGYQLWECSIDLCEFIAKRHSTLKNFTVLELGCGHALPSVLASKLGAQVSVQDFNENVLIQATRRNFELNRVEAVDYYSGSWGDLKVSNLFDLILTSETIYNSENYDQLIDLISRSLKVEGKVYLAAKSVYFGLDGSIDLFLVACQEKLRLVERNIINTIGVKREIIVLVKIC